MLPRPSRLKSLASELSPVLTTPPPVEPNTVFVLMSVPEMMLSSNLVVLRRRAAMSAAMPPRIDAARRRRSPSRACWRTDRRRIRAASFGGAFGAPPSAVPASALRPSAARRFRRLGLRAARRPSAARSSARLGRLGRFGLRRLRGLRRLAPSRVPAPWAPRRPVRAAFGDRRRRRRRSGAAGGGALPFAASACACSCAIVWLLQLDRALQVLQRLLELGDARLRFLQLPGRARPLPRRRLRPCPVRPRAKREADRVPAGAAGVFSSTAVPILPPAARPPAPSAAGAARGDASRYARQSAACTRTTLVASGGADVADARRRSGS